MNADKLPGRSARHRRSATRRRWKTGNQLAAECRVPLSLLPVFLLPETLSENNVEQRRGRQNDYRQHRGSLIPAKAVLRRAFGERIHQADQLLLFVRTREQ